MILSRATIVKKSISLSHNCIILGCELEKEIDYENGQFVVRQYPIGDKIYKRSYSIYNSFENSNSGSYLEFHIKKVPGGVVSNHIIDIAQIGDSFELIGGVGKMTEKQANSYLFVGIGSGLSPLHALFDGLVRKNFTGKIGILYGERFYNDLIPECINSFPNNSESIVKKICLSQENVGGFEFGRLQTKIDDMIDFVGKNSQIYICGKPEMVDDVVGKLYDHGFAKEQIHFEKY